MPVAYFSILAIRATVCYPMYYKSVKPLHLLYTDGPQCPFTYLVSKENV